MSLVMQALDMCNNQAARHASSFVAPPLRVSRTNRRTGSSIFRRVGPLQLSGLLPRP